MRDKKKNRNLRIFGAIKSIYHAFEFPRRYDSGSKPVDSKISLATFCGSVTPAIAWVARILYLLVVVNGCWFFKCHLVKRNFFYVCVHKPEQVKKNMIFFIKRDVKWSPFRNEKKQWNRKGSNISDGQKKW